jgi:quercetin 2,3-dioxygenase
LLSSLIISPLAFRSTERCVRSFRGRHLILSWVLARTLEHKDSLGTGAKIHPGELQRMTAGSGVTHSEFNGSKIDPVHFLQIWVIPKRTGLTPTYEQRTFPPQELSNRWRLLASGDPRNGAITIHRDIELFGTRLSAGQRLDHVTSPGHMLWLQVARGSVETDGDVLLAGDGAAWSDATSIHVSAKGDTELLPFDMTPEDSSVTTAR